MLGRGHKVRSSGGTREVKECCYDIPLLESLQALQKNVSVYDQVISERAKRVSSVTVHAPLKFKTYIFVVQAYVGFRILYVRPFYGPNYGGVGQSTGKTC